ncbi:hypothetical protein [Methylovorus mays]|uniref:hypothetical protein n=1 Tax=Methylovorus mays TaxID=184077 RepID=UPI001E6503D6|nr:hypothetical protein [Methylovorus mays]MCB5207369.1 hypothetical protein [Methylovorus mays]
MKNPNPRKTHPLVLVAAVALTIFSLLGSAAITGLIPVHSEKQDAAQSLTDGRHRDAAIAKPQAAAAPVPDQHSSACSSCGTIISIRTVEGEAIAPALQKPALQAPDRENEKLTAYIIQVRMVDGATHTITQYDRPRIAVGEQVRLSIGRQLNA